MKTMYDELIKIRNRGKIPFHMPGSRGGAAVPEQYKRDILALDYTELDETDNYRNPKGIIYEAHNRIAEAYGAHKSIISVNGATGGILAAFGYISSLGKKVIADRNCHVSVINALQMFKISTVFFMPEYLENFGITGKTEPQKLEKLLDKHDDAAAVFITSPNYYGITSDISKLSEICRKKNVLLCVDAAHGAHFAFYNNLPQCAVDAGADIVIHSVHKTLPSVTQTALVHLSKKINYELFYEWMCRFTTTSPSYILMAYADFSVSYMKENGESIYRRLEEYIYNFKKNCRIKIVGSDDFSRIVLNINGGGYRLAENLRSGYNIEAEAADLNNVILIAGTGNTKEHFKELEKACAEYSDITDSDTVLNGNFFCCEEIYRPPDGLYEKTEKRALKESIGMKVSRAVTIYPPGVPLLLPGEIITEKAAECIRNVFNSGGTVLGMDGGIDVIK